MNRKNNFYRTAMIILVTALLSVIVTTIYYYNSIKKGNFGYLNVGSGDITANDDQSSISEDEIIEKSIVSIKKILEKYYLGEMPSDSETVDTVIKAYVKSLGDEYTQYMTADDWKAYSESVFGNYIGLGVVLSAHEKGEEILSMFKDSPAEKYGLQVGDILTKVDGMEFNAESATEVISYIKGGEPGTTVKIELIRGEETLTKELVRETVRILQVETEMLEGNIGYVSLMTFDIDSAEDFRNEINQLKIKGAKKLIIDLRGNTGGYLTEALKISEMFLDKDAIMLLSRAKDNKEKEYKSSTKKEIDMPVVILCDEISASSSEVMIAALKDNKVATVIGTKTYGKGVMQDVLTLTNGASLKVTTEEFVSPNGDKINKVGITPDIEIEKVQNVNEEGNQIVSADNDAQLQKAIEVLKEKD